MFFTYVDCRPDGTPFYVGKGTLTRVNRKPRPNKHHTNICKKHPNWYRGLAFMGSEKDAFIKEMELIEKYKATLVNRTNGGEGNSNFKGWKKGRPMLPHVKEILLKANLGRKLSEEHKQAISNANKSVKRSKGYKHTAESLEKMSIASKNHIRTPEWKQKIAESVKLNWAKRKAI